MTEHDHDEIARRLRESGTVPAPEQLRAEVMDHVRAEPRRRPARRPFLPRLLPYAAAAALVVAAVIAIGHFGGSGSYSGSASSGANGASGGGRALGGGQALHSPEAADRGQVKRDGGGNLSDHPFSIAPRYLQVLAPTDVLTASPSARPVVVVVPRPLYAAYLARFRFFQRHSHADQPVRVILRPAPRN
jgi:hypothetical protein